jgi:hypothetical protein
MPYGAARFPRVRGRISLCARAALWQSKASRTASLLYERSAIEPRGKRQRTVCSSVITRPRKRGRVIAPVKRIKPDWLRARYSCREEEARFYKSNRLTEGLPKPQEVIMAKKSFVGMLALALVFGFALTGCPTDDDSSNETFPAAKGKITINGLSSYNDRYVYGAGMAGSTLLIGLTDITGYGTTDLAYKLVKISGGKAEVPLYYVNSGATSYADSYLAYEGNDTISVFSLLILDDDDGFLKQTDAASISTSAVASKSLTSGTFSSGNLTIAWQ